MKFLELEAKYLSLELTTLGKTTKSSKTQSLKAGGQKRSDDDVSSSKVGYNGDGEC